MDIGMLLVWLCGGFAACGGIQYIKGVIPSGVTIPSWVWAIVLPLMCVGWSVVPAWAQCAWGILAVSQLGYENIVQVIKKKLGFDSSYTKAEAIVQSVAPLVPAPVAEVAEKVEVAVDNAGQA